MQCGAEKVGFLKVDLLLWSQKTLSSMCLWDIVMPQKRFCGDHWKNTQYIAHVSKHIKNIILTTRFFKISDLTVNNRQPVTWRWWSCKNQFGKSSTTQIFPPVTKHCFYWWMRWWLALVAANIHIGLEMFIAYLSQEGFFLAMLAELLGWQCWPRRQSFTLIHTEISQQLSSRLPLYLVRIQRMSSKRVIPWLLLSCIGY